MFCSEYILYSQLQNAGVDLGQEAGYFERDGVVGGWDSMGEHIRARVEEAFVDPDTPATDGKPFQ